MRHKRDATGRNTVFLCTAAMTLLLMGLLLFHYIKYDRPRTLHHCLELIDGDPLTYSEDSGFFEESSDGEYSGLCEYQGSFLAFKRDRISLSASLGSAVHLSAMVLSAL